MMVLGGNLQAVGCLTREGGCQEELKRLDQMKKEERRASFETRCLMNFFCLFEKPSLISI